MGMVTVQIDNQRVEIEEGATILQAAAKAGIKIPTLCYLEGINEIGACRICVVEVEGARTLMASCVTPVANGMVVRTNTPRVREARKLNLELLLSNHPMECPTCVRNTNC
ncbi:MAG: (2Fe-2S)-binding protein, partial [Clostridia bacterium]|nr:(2Fe-2S)-binding protein [Clostridia bacterium]